MDHRPTAGKTSGAEAGRSIEERRKTKAKRSLEDSTTLLTQARDRLRDVPITNLKYLLPLFLQLRGKPYKLDDHFPFEPFFDVAMPANTVLKTGRQVSKSTSLAAQGIMLSNTIPHFNTLFVTPLFEMIRRFSANYVKPFIEDSPVRSQWTNSRTEHNVLQRSFTNRSKMFFSFAFLDANRIRGYNNDKVSYDEFQHMDSDFVPVIRETMSGSKWRISQFAGTPTTLEGPLELKWADSSQAEWAIRCQACRYLNIPALDYDLDKMIGPYSDDISEERPAVVCAKCARSVFPRQGRWLHAFPERRLDFAGYHVPQIIMPMHYAEPSAWGELLGKREGAGNTSTNVFYNEVCGESYDLGAKLVTITDLKAAARLPANSLENAKARLGQYVDRILAVDWGGGGQKGVSFTAAAMVGLLPNGKIEVPFGWRSLTPHDHIGEARQILKLLGELRCSHLVHDYSGAGSVRETVIASSGFPGNLIIPMSYIRAARGLLMRHMPYNENTGQRDYYQVDKSRSLGLVCNQIRNGWIQFFEYDYKGEGRTGLLHDFLALMEDRIESRTGLDIYTVVRNEKMTDDFAQAVNMGCCALWYRSGRWPDLAAIANMEMSKEAMAMIEPLSEKMWEDELGAGFFNP